MKDDTGIMDKKKYSDEEKLKAAYALNMCTVSVSQIVDYHDSYILDQEYEAILNNLNLEQIPKDEALLRILVELLNTISFFKVQDIKKKQIERKYQTAMKNAIWSAIPNIGVIVTSGNPIAIGVSLATQIGAGYMNYRRVKAQGMSEKEDAEIELQITALEQFNALKRELFTTAWRLAAEYGFEDRLRLTERQIKQYNEILMDEDDLRKYARMESIKDKFAAYPPFWYFFGHTACCVAESFDESEVKQTYREYAKEHFQHYEKLNKFNILREDQMTASFALEYIDLLFMEPVRDDNKIYELLKTALDKAGNQFDILQLCAISFLRIGNSEEAARILKILINEDYNKVLNAQLLSGYLVRTRNIPEYKILRTRVSPRYLYPMPTKADGDRAFLNATFEKEQRQLMKEKFRIVLRGVISYYDAQLNKRISVFDLDADYEEEFFEDTNRAKRKRMTNAKEVYADEMKWNYYIERMQNLNLQLEYINAFEKMFSDLFRCGFCSDRGIQNDMVTLVSNSVLNKGKMINQIQDKVTEGNFGIREYERLQKAGMKYFVKEAFEKLFRDICSRIERMNVDDLMLLEGELLNLCDRTGIPIPEIPVDGEIYHDDDFDGGQALFDVSLFGNKAIIAKNNMEYIKQMGSYIKTKMERVHVGEEFITVIYRDSIEFERYFNNSIFENYPALKANSLMVLKDNTKKKFDLIFTTEGIVYVLRDKVRKKAPYENIKFEKDALDLYGKTYRNPNIDLGALYEISQGFHKKFINNIEKKTEYIEGVVTGKELNQWFLEKKEAMSGTVERVYAWPKVELMGHMGFVMEKNLDPGTHLLQFYYDKQSSGIMDYRIVEFDAIDSVFASKLTQSGGIIKVEGR